jgi:hypothetical protein
MSAASDGEVIVRVSSRRRRFLTFSTKAYQLRILIRTR